MSFGEDGIFPYRLGLGIIYTFHLEVQKVVNGYQLKITISRCYPELDSIVIVDSQGTIFLPKLGRIFVEGLSLNELNESSNLFVM